MLLSTDEEIGEQLYARLAPAVSRSFTIVYDKETRGSRIEPGYAFSAKHGLEAA